MLGVQNLLEESSLQPEIGLVMYHTMCAQSIKQTTQPRRLALHKMNFLLCSYLAFFVILVEIDHFEI